MVKTKSKNSNQSNKQEISNKNASIGGDVKDSIVVVGDGNQTNFQKIINIFKGDSESLDQRNRRVMLNHMENFWIKGVLEKSLHGVALLELGIKENPNAINYPWGIKRASTNETLPPGKSMSEIFKEIGLGRSLLILGTPGSGKTTMLLELTRQLILTARNDENEPIPVVFNLASWTEKLTLADWLAEQLNIFYYVPKKTAQKLVIDNKMFLLLDGLDEVKEDLRGKCVDAINKFKIEHGLTSLVICSRIEEYQAIQTKLSLAGAITLQPLTSEQVDSYFDKFGKSLTSLKQILKKDKTLHELTETPLMLSIMVSAYKNVNIKEIPEFKNIKEQRKHIFDTYIKRMFEHSTRSEQTSFKKPETLLYLSWLARKMIQHDATIYQIETMQSSWLENKKQEREYKLFIFLLVLVYSMLFGGLHFGLFGGLLFGLFSRWMIIGSIFGLFSGLFFWLFFGMSGKIIMADKFIWSWKEIPRGLMYGVIGGLIILLVGRLVVGQSFGLFGGVFYLVINSMNFGLRKLLIEKTSQPGQRLRRTCVNALFFVISIYLIFSLSAGLIFSLSSVSLYEILMGLMMLQITWFLIGARGGSIALIQHHTLRFIQKKYKLLPMRLIPFLEYSVDLIFFHRVGGSYIFVHRLLMEHFAEMYVEKENK